MRRSPGGDGPDRREHVPGEVGGVAPRRHTVPSNRLPAAVQPVAGTATLQYPGTTALVVRRLHTLPEFSSGPTPHVRWMPELEPDGWAPRGSARPLAALAGLTVLLAPYVVGTRADYPALFWTAVAVVGFFAAWAWWRFRGPRRTVAA